MGDDLHPQTDVDAAPHENRAAARAALQSDRSSLGEKLAAAHQHFSCVPVENSDFVEAVSRANGKCCQLLHLIDLNAVVPFRMRPGVEDCAPRGGDSLGQCGFAVQLAPYWIAYPRKMSQSSSLCRGAGASERCGAFPLTGRVHDYASNVRRAEDQSERQPRTGETREHLKTPQ